MPKRMHPAEKLVRAMDLWGYKTYEQKQRIVLRHIKPLLKNLAGEHLFYGTDGTRCPNGHAEYCDVCRLLDSWESKL